MDDEVQSYVAELDIPTMEKEELLKLILNYGDECHKWGYNWGVKDGEARECQCGRA